MRRRMFRQGRVTKMVQQFINALYYREKNMTWAQAWNFAGRVIK